MQLLKPSSATTKGTNTSRPLDSKWPHCKVDTSKSGELCHSLDVAMWMSGVFSQDHGCCLFMVLAHWARDMADLTSHLQSF